MNLIVHNNIDTGQNDTILLLRPQLIKYLKI